MFFKSRFLLFLCCCFPFVAFAVVNPVTFSLSPAGGFPTSTQVGSSYAAVYTLTNNLPFPVLISNVTRTHTGSHGFSTIDACKGAVLFSGGTCLIHVSLQPKTVGFISTTLTVHYDKNVVPLLPALSTTAENVGTADIVGAVAGKLPSKVTTGVGHQFEFAYTNTGSADVTPTSVPVSATNGAISGLVNNCTSPLSIGASCTITGVFTAAADGVASVSATYHYVGGSVPLTSQTTANSSAGGSLTAITALALPASTYQYADNVVKFEFVNNNASGSITLSNNASVTASLNGGAALSGDWLVAGTNQCTSGKTLTPNTGTSSTPSAGSYCYVYASVVPQTTGSNLAVEAQVSYNANSETATTSTSSSTVLANNTTNRVLTVVNQCPFPVWMTFNAGALSGGPSTCSMPDPNSASQKSCAGAAGTQSTCDTGAVCGGDHLCYYTATPSPNPCGENAVCNTSANAYKGLCYYTDPAWSGHPDGRLNAAVHEQTPDVINFTLNNPPAGQSVIYNGAIAARTGCDSNGENCKVNNCATIGADGMCAPGSGPNNNGFTFNELEFTFATTGDGSYDETTLNGINVPMEMKGRGPLSLSTSPYFNCQAAGAVIAQAATDPAKQLGGCTYDYQTPTTDPNGNPVNSSNYAVVVPTSSLTTCTASSDLSTCGLGYNSITNQIDKYYGELAGYITVGAGICPISTFTGNAANLKTEYACSTTFTDPTDSSITYLGSLLFMPAYPPMQSCYNEVTTPSTYCGGCVDWWTPEGGSLSVPSSTKSCGGNSNPNWVNTVQSQIQWIKKACPTAYSYTYDDVSSSFTCDFKVGSKTVTNYQVTFCPGGATLENPYPAS